MGSALLDMGVLCFSFVFLLVSFLFACLMRGWCSAFAICMYFQSLRVPTADGINLREDKPITSDSGHPSRRVPII